MKHYAGAIALLLALPLAGCDLTSSRDQIIQKIIDRSITGYSGSCPCPYSVNAGGHSCGGTSAYSQGGGAAIICYSSDVTEAMIQAYQIGFA